MNETLLDTDMLSEVLKARNPRVLATAARYLQERGRFAFSIFTKFEIERGYRAKDAAKLEARFAEFCARSLILPLDQDVFDRSVELWATLRWARVSRPRRFVPRPSEKTSVDGDPRRAGSGDPRPARA